MTEDEIMAEMPEHAKAEAVKSEMAAIGEFLEWLFGEKEYALMDSDNDYVAPNVEALLSEFFEIDQVAYMREKDLLLERIRSMTP